MPHVYCVDYPNCQSGKRSRQRSTRHVDSSKDEFEVLFGGQSKQKQKQTDLKKKRRRRRLWQQQRCGGRWGGKVCRHCGGRGHLTWRSANCSRHGEYKQDVAQKAREADKTKKAKAMGRGKGKGKKRKKPNKGKSSKDDMNRPNNLREVDPSRLRQMQGLVIKVAADNLNKFGDVSLVVSVKHRRRNRNGSQTCQLGLRREHAQHPGEEGPFANHETRPRVRRQDRV